MLKHVLNTLKSIQICYMVFLFQRIFYTTIVSSNVYEEIVSSINIACIIFNIGICLLLLLFYYCCCCLALYLIQYIQKIKLNFLLIVLDIIIIFNR
jgi:hypothetical protein